jgi:hypothetical protein
MHSPIQSRFAIASREATELYIATCSHTTEAHVSVEAQLLALLPMPGKQLKGSLPQGDHGIVTKQSCRARWSAMSSNQLSRNTPSTALISVGAIKPRWHTVME